MSRTPLSRRNSGSSTFIPDTTSGIDQYTPRLSTMPRHAEARSPFTLSQKPHSNFIADSIITEGPRALSVSETGEKRQIDLNDEIHKFHTNPFITSRNASFIVIDPDYPAADVSSKILESHLPKQTDEIKLTPSDSKTHLKRKEWRYIYPKGRLLFTPRTSRKSIGLTTETSEDLLKNAISNTHVETQTETIWQNCSRSSQVSFLQPVPQKRKHYKYHESKSKQLHSIEEEELFKLVPKALLAMHLQNASNSNGEMKLPTLLQSPYPSPLATPLPSPKRKPTSRSASRSSSSSTSTSTSVSTNPFSQKADIQEFSEVSSFATTATFITVISILVLALFQVNGTKDFFIKLWSNLKEILLGIRAKPKTKREMFTQFFQDFWL